MTYREFIDWVQEETTNTELSLLNQYEIKNSSNNSFDAQLLHGKSLSYVLLCNNDWHNFELSIIEELKHNLSQQDFETALKELPFHDSHWDWVKKYKVLNKQGYDWFYLIVNKKLQAISIIRHPKQSVFDGENIFYIEYIAVAPWNRKCKYFTREFKKTGTILIKGISEYYIKQFGYRPGFSLSAVPQAVDFYKSIGMTPFPEEDHDRLFFYEMKEEDAVIFLQGGEK